MSRNKALNAKLDRRSWLMEYCRDYMAGLIKCSSILKSAIAACLNSSKRKYYPQEARK